VLASQGVLTAQQVVLVLANQRRSSTAGLLVLARKGVLVGC
jgi:hypothetical protein